MGFSDLNKVISVISISTLFAIGITILLGFQGVQADSFRDRSSAPVNTDFESFSNTVYDVSSSSRNYRALNGLYDSRDYKKQNRHPFPKRVSLKVEDGKNNFKACGGFSGGFEGTCCSACESLNFQEGCWCRSFDCLCYQQ